MQIFEKTKYVRFLIFFCALNLFLSFLLEPADGSSSAMWSEYYEQEELELVFVGASVTAATFDPNVFEKELGIKSFNMGTPAQGMKQSIDALEILFEEHPEIKTVVFGMGFFSFQSWPSEDAEMTFRKALAREKGGISGLKETLKYIFSKDVRGTEKSINYFLPWFYNQGTVTAEGICENVLLKINKKEEEIFDAQSDKRKNWRLSKGYSPYTGYMDYEKTGYKTSASIYGTDILYEMIGDFKKLLALCEEEGVELIVVNTPHPTYDTVASFGSYAEMEKITSELCEEYGASYYNFSLAKPELFAGSEKYFYDFEHLNYEGSQIFCKQFCDFLVKRENGEDVDKLFYSVDEFYEWQDELVKEWMGR